MSRLLGAAVIGFLMSYSLNESLNPIQLCIIGAMGLALLLKGGAR